MILPRPASPRRAARRLGPSVALFALGALCALVLEAPPAAAQVFDPRTATLDNGMEVVVVTNERAPVVTHMVWYRVGAIDEPPGKSGLAHLTEHLMFKGTDTLAPGEFSRIVSRNGGRENAFTGPDYSGYFQSVAVDRLERMMEIESDRMANLRLTSETVAPEVRVVLEERRSRVENEPAARLSERVGAALYMNHPYRLPVIGWAHEIAALTHEDALDFYEAWYAPNNAILVVVGDVTMDEVLPMAERTYGRVRARALPERVDWREPGSQVDARLTLSDPKVTNPSWARRYLAPSYMAGASEHAYALQVLREILSGGASARLYASLVVERGIAASAGAWYDPNRRGPGSFGFFASPRPGVAPATVEAAVEDQIATLLAEGVSADELDRAKSRLIDSTILARDSLSRPARVLGAALAIGRGVEDVESWPDRIEAVTREEVLAAARHVLEGTAAITSLLLPEETG